MDRHRKFFCFPGYSRYYYWLKTYINENCLEIFRKDNFCLKEIIEETFLEKKNI